MQNAGYLNDLGVFLGGRLTPSPLRNHSVPGPSGANARGVSEENGLKLDQASRRNGQMVISAACQASLRTLACRYCRIPCQMSFAKSAHAK